MNEGATLSSSDLQVHLDGYDGPLELLLELARSQRVDLTRISIVALVDQFVTAVAAMQRRDLARATEWLVMAAWLTWLKSRLMLPQELEEAKQGSEAGQVLIERLAELDRIRSICHMAGGAAPTWPRHVRTWSRLLPNGAGRGGRPGRSVPGLPQCFAETGSPANPMSIYRHASPSGRQPKLASGCLQCLRAFRREESY